MQKVSMVDGQIVVGAWSGSLVERWNKTCGQSSCQTWICRSDAEGRSGASHQHVHGLLGTRC